MGVDRVEMDVQQTSDGVVICLHDKKLDRTTSGKGKVADLSLDELKSVRANKGFETDFSDEVIPTLEQVFELLDEKTQFVIEIKAGNKTYPGIEDNVVNLIRKYKAEKWALIHSFNDKVLKFIHKSHPDIRLQKLFVSFSGGLMLDFRLHSARLSDYDYVEGYGISKGGVNKKLIDKIHQQGKVVHVWTVNSAEDIQKMIGLGVDGIISNYPARVKTTLKDK